MRRMVAVVCVLALAGLIRAEEKKANPTGTWKYTVEVNGEKRDVTFKLKLDGDKLTGTVGIADQETKIEDAKYKDGEASFKVSPEFNGNKLTIKYSGKFSGDTFKGKREIDRDGQTNTRDFEAKRVKE
jgi:hypothetical protein